MVARLVAVLTVLMAISGSTIPAQTPDCITLRIEIPDERGNKIREISTPEGKATAGVQIRDGDEYPTVYLDLTVRDLASGLIRVSIRDDQDSDRVVDQFDLQIGGESVRTTTKPSFGLSVLRIFERVGGVCRV
jgi:hypothetical protein